jgi:hypothetical protein
MTVANQAGTILISGETDAEEPRQSRSAEIQALKELFESWVDVGADEIREQTETFAMLKRALSENRPPELRKFHISEDETMASVMNSPATASDDVLSFDERRRRRIEFSRPAVALLQSWLEDDEESEEEQRAGLEELKRAIDSHRPPDQRVFS